MSQPATSLAEAREAEGGRRQGIVDVDVHPVPSSVDEIRERMPMPFRDRYQGERRSFFNNPVHGSRLDAVPPGGGPKGSDPDFLRKQLIDEYGVAYAILISRTFCNIHPDPDYAAAIAAAFNEWLVEVWLTENNHDGAFKGSITIAQQDPARAVEEIERWAGHEHIVQVTMDSGARMPFGQRYYYPIYEACERHGLPLPVHPGTEGMGINQQPTPGYPTHYIEWHCAMSLAFQAHLISILTEGVFERYPGLRLVLVEGGRGLARPAAVAARLLLEGAALGGALGPQATVRVRRRPRQARDAAAREARRRRPVPAAARDARRQAHPDVLERLPALGLRLADPRFPASRR